MVELKNEKTIMYGKGIPKVKFENTHTRMAISNMFQTDRNIYEYLGLVLLRLGYQSEDEILIHSYNKNSNYFMCTANKNNTCRMLIDKDNSEIIVEKHNYVYGYECIPEDRNEIGMKISLGRYVIKYADGVTITRYLSRDNAKYVVEVCDNKIELELDRPSDLELRMFDENGRYAKYELENEGQLIEYLTTIGPTKNIIELYQDLHGYLDNIDRYPNFCLKTFVNCYGDYVPTNLIQLKNGEFEQFEITEFNTTIFIDRYNNWSYKNLFKGGGIDFSMSSQDGKVDCGFTFNREDYHIYESLSYIIDLDVNRAIDKVSNVKRRVRTLFDNNKGSN